MIRVEVDFNTRDDAGLVPALIEDAAVPLAVGDRVDAFDDEGYRCLAEVASINNVTAQLAPIWQTFSEPGEAFATVQRVSPRMWSNGRIP